MRPLEELLTPEDAWVEVVAPLVAGAGARCRVLPTTAERGRAALHSLQVTRRSTLGALALGCAGILVDGGWLRIFGAGDPAGGFEGLVDWNPAGDAAAMAAQGYCLVAADVLGGFFAIDGGRFGAPGRVFYLDPRDLSWAPLDVGYTDWVGWAIGSDVGGFYEDLRWDGWEREVAALGLDRGIHCYPPLWTTEGRDVSAVSRASVPLRELWGVARSTHEQLLGSTF